MCYSAMIQQDVSFLESKLNAVVSKSDWLEYENLRQDPEDPLPKLQERIFPGYYGPVASMTQSGAVINLMKYSVDPPDFISDGKRYTVYNARRDNLHSPFWGDCYQRRHGIVVMKEFYEWVVVRDLIKAGKVSLEEVKQLFEEQKKARKARLSAANRPYKPTRAELTEATFRKVVISFRADSQSELLVPVIFSQVTRPNGQVRRGFAIITDDPPAEVEATGHDRCPVILSEEGAQSWLRAPLQEVDQSDEILAQRSKLTFSHELDRSVL